MSKRRNPPRRILADSRRIRCDCVDEEIKRERAHPDGPRSESLFGALKKGPVKDLEFDEEENWDFRRPEVSDSWNRGLFMETFARIAHRGKLAERLSPPVRAIFERNDHWYMCLATSGGFRLAAAEGGEEARAGSWKMRTRYRISSGRRWRSQMTKAQRGT